MNNLFITGLRLGGEIPADNYLARIPLTRLLAESGGLQINSPVTFFVGDNGAGKSTLVEGIALSMGFNAEGGTRSFCFSTADATGDLERYLTLIKGVRRPSNGFFLRAESFWNLASYIDRLDDTLVESYGGISLHNRSHGESFMELIQDRFAPDGLYILDEPEAALSPTRLMSLMCVIHSLESSSQFIISTHSPILTSYPGADIFELREDSIKKVAYRDTDNYIITKRFLDDPDGMLRLIFK